MLKSLSALVLLCALLIPITTANAQFTNASLQGDYLLTQYLDDDTDGASAGLAFLHFDGNGDGGFELFYNSIGDVGSGNMTYSVETDGTFTLQTDDETIRGVIEPGGASFTMVELDSEVQGFYAATRISSGFTEADLVGEYLTVGFGHAPTTGTQAKRSSFVSAVFDGSGSGSYSTFLASDGDLQSGTFNYTVGDSGTVWIQTDNDTLRGAVSTDKELLLAVQTGGGGHATFVGIKKSTGNSNSTLEGTFVSSRLNYENQNSFSEYADFSFDGNGNGLFQTIQTSEGESDSENFSYSVADDGSWVIPNVSGVLGVQSSSGNWFTIITTEGELSIIAGIRGNRLVLDAEDDLPNSELSSLRIYPSPLQSQATIEFDLVRAGRVQLEVFDIFGKRVSQILDKELPTGNHEVQWTPNGLVPGVYFYRLSSKNEILTSKSVKL